LDTARRVDSTGISVVVPARDEERVIARCVESIHRAADHASRGVETIVVLNRCADGTGAAALAAGARIVAEDARSISAVRNAGVRASKGAVVVTLDADSLMHPDALSEVAAALDSGIWVGGGVPIRPERMSAGILMTGVLMALTLGLPFGVSAGMFWFLRRDFDAIGGFDERRLVAEDIDFARRLKAHGRKTGRRFGTLWRAPITTSCRKFDAFGDWFVLKRPWLLFHAIRGTRRDLADKYFYDFRH